MDEHGFIYLEFGRPMWCRKWGTKIWLMFWHRDGHFVSSRPILPSDVDALPRNLTVEEQQLYRDAHDKYNEQFTPTPAA